jgi:hypothetical protein
MHPGRRAFGLWQACTHAPSVRLGARKPDTAYVLGAPLPRPWPAARFCSIMSNGVRVAWGSRTRAGARPCSRRAVMSAGSTSGNEHCRCVLFPCLARRARGSQGPALGTSITPGAAPWPAGDISFAYMSYGLTIPLPRGLAVASAGHRARRYAEAGPGGTIPQPAQASGRSHCKTAPGNRTRLDRSPRLLCPVDVRPPLKPPRATMPCIARLEARTVAGAAGRGHAPRAQRRRPRRRARRRARRGATKRPATC